MARTIRNDELNILETFETYFSEMALTQDEIRERIDVAVKIYEVVIHVFDVARVGKKLDDEFDMDYMIEYITGEYGDILFENEEVAQELIDYARGNVEKYVKTTAENINTDYYTSSERAVEIAETETNDYLNYKRHEKHVKMGYTKKRWDSMKDEKVRHTHIFADGQEVDITEPFKVGMYDMMFPLDGSLGAGAEEIVNCRCVAIYSK